MGFYRRSEDGVSWIEYESGQANPALIDVHYKKSSENENLLGQSPPCSFSDDLLLHYRFIGTAFPTLPARVRQL